MTMAFGSCQIHCRPWLALCFAGLLLISAGSPCDARWLPLEKNHRKRDISMIIVVVLLLVGTLLVVLLRQHCCRCGSPVGHAAEEEEEAAAAAAEGRITEFSIIKKLFGPFAMFKIQRILEEDDPMSIAPTMKISPCGSPKPRHWVRHASQVRHHRCPLPEPSSHQQNPAAAVDSCLRDMAPVSEGPLKQFSYWSLAKATKDFKKGDESRSGVLYAGRLLFDDTLVKEVAIKRFHKNVTADDCDQIREDLKRKKYMLQHRNLVKLFGYCLHDGKLYLVYDWMRYHSLDYELFAEKDSPLPALTLVQRQVIIKDAARGLLQLHDRNAFHGAVKASNIMLEPTSSGFRGRLADFRYSTLLAAEHQGSEPAATSGTLRSLLYPEWIRVGPSLETDVLHFGGMMLEVLCGRRLFAREQLPTGCSSLVDWVQQLHGEARLDAALDENAKRAPDFNKAQADVLLRLALGCSNPEPKHRPTIRTVLAELSKEARTKIEPKSVRTTTNHVRNKRKALSVG